MVLVKLKELSHACDESGGRLQVVAEFRGSDVGDVCGVWVGLLFEGEFDGVYPLITEVFCE